MSDCKKSPVYIDSTSGSRVKLVKIDELKRRLEVCEEVSKCKIVMDFSPGFSALAYFLKYFKEEQL